MDDLNNVIPFSLIVTGQTQIASGLASVLNATTPLFAAVILAAFGDEKLVGRKILGIAIGLAGVIVLRGQGFDAIEGKTLGMALCLGAAASYGFAACGAAAGSPASRRLRQQPVSSSAPPSSW